MYITNRLFAQLVSSSFKSIIKKCSPPASTIFIKHYLHRSVATTDINVKTVNNSLLEQILTDAKRTTLTNDEYNLHSLINDEILVIRQILQKLVGTNHSLSEIQKLFSDDHSLEKFIRGFVVLLMSKAANSKCQQPVKKNITGIQWRLAKIVEMVHISIFIHKQIRNVNFNTLNTADIHLSNKISVLHGDFLWAKAWKELADMGDIEVIDMMVSVLVNLSEGQFLSEIELTDLANKLNVDYWYKKNYLLAACLPAFGCKSTLKLEKLDGHLQKHAYEFGQNFGFFNKAYEEIKWFSNDLTNEPIDFCSLPMIMHYNETGQSLKHLIHLNQLNKAKIEFDCEELFNIVRNGPGLMKSKNILNNFRHKSLQNLCHFPNSEAKEYLKNILEAMDV